MKSVMTNHFSLSPNADIPRSSFNRSHGYKTTFNCDNLVPIFVDEALPGDTFNLKASVFARLATPTVPFMDNLFCDFFFFAVPVRLVWDNWQKFNGEQLNPGDSTDYLVPQMVSPSSGSFTTGYPYQSLSDYFGIPTLVPGLTHSSLYHRAYNLIWNEWFRDENLQDRVVVDLDDGPDDPLDYMYTRTRGKRHDYFTSCLPWPQKGPSVPIPLEGSADVVRDSNATFWKSYVAGTNTLQNAQTPFVNASGNLTASPGGTGMSLDPNGGLSATLSTATNATINSLRQAFQLQKLYERDARGGTRYIEVIKAHFGVTSPDARLQRPEYLGGGSSRINVNPVAQTSSTDATTPQGNLAAFGTMSGSGIGFVKSFTEHCIILGMAAVRADLNYQQGLNRMFSRRTRWDFYWPALSHIGEQAVLNKEIYAQGNANLVEDEEVFGYQERFAEYRYKPSLVTGKFRSNDAQSLDNWHLAQDFSALPALGDSFIRSNTPIDRVVAVPSEPDVLFDSYFDLTCARPMPTYSIPGLVDHF